MPRPTSSALSAPRPQPSRRNKPGRVRIQREHGLHAAAGELRELRRERIRVVEQHEVRRAHKPFARAYAQAVEKLGLPIDQIAVIGDQIYTDVFGGNRAGALTCYVETLDRRFFWINVRYQLERGFIARGRRRMEARRHD